MFSKEYQEELHGCFIQAMEELGEKSKKIREMVTEEKEELRPALEFLYASMPESDIYDYSYDTYRKYAEHGKKLWEEREKNIRNWEVKVPEKLFANYVLHHRANNEDLAVDRGFFYEKLQPVIQGKTMKDAIIAVNYWLSQIATYQVTDDRTASGKTVYHSALGRCGEESVFAVSAYRSVGIPARQVYVPLWSHCDDNHAWVEVWCDGTWKFLGACEPEEILNKGWFTNASSRAMQVQSRWFGCDKPADDVVGKKGMSSIVNHLGIYARTKTLQIKVSYEDGTPASDLTVICSVLNYGAFGEVARVHTDENGEGKLVTGLGSLKIQAAVDGKYGEMVVDVRNTDRAEVVLKENPFLLEQWQEIELFAPEDYPVNGDQPTREQKEQGAVKVKEAADYRRKRVEEFYREDEARRAVEFCPNPEVAEKILRESRGNFDTVCAFMKWKEQDEKTWTRKINLLCALREKDYWDLDPEVIKSHMAAVERYEDQSGIPEEIYNQYILNPRIDREMLNDYAAFIQEFFSEETIAMFRSEPKKVVEYVKERIESHPEKEYSTLITSPKGCLLSGVGSEWSKAILCVAIYRAIGIPARLNPVDKNIEIYQNGLFVSMQAAENSREDTRTSVITVHPDGKNNWKYAQSWSISRFRDGVFIPLDLETDENPHRPLPAEAGIYRLLTVNRLPNGNIFAKQFDFELGECEKKELTLSLKEAELSEMLSESQILDFELKTEAEESLMVSSIEDGNKKLLIWLEESREPTEHILNEMYERADQFSKYQKDIYFILSGKEAKEDPTLQHTLERLPEIQFLYDDFGANVQTLARRMYVDPDKLPLIVVMKPGMKGIYAASGYNVGTSDMLLRVLDM